MDVLDSFNAEFLFGNGPSDALKAFDVRPGIPPMIRAGFVRRDQAFPFVVPECLDRHAKHSGDCSDGIDWSEISCIRLWSSVHVSG